MYIHTYLVKEQSELSLRLSHPLAEAVCPLPHEEGDLLASLGALVGQCSGHQCLSAAWGAIEQHSTRGIDLEALKNLWVEERENDHLFQGSYVVLEATNGVKGDVTVNVHWIDVCKAGSNANTIPHGTVGEVLGCKVHGQALRPTFGHAACLSTPKPSLVRVRPCTNNNTESPIISNPRTGTTH